MYSNEEMGDKLKTLGKKLANRAKNISKKPLSAIQDLKDIPDEDIHKIYRFAFNGEELDQWQFAKQHTILMGETGKQIIIDHTGVIFVPLGVNIFKLVKYLIELGYYVEE